MPGPIDDRYAVPSTGLPQIDPRYKQYRNVPGQSGAPMNWDVLYGYDPSKGQAGGANRFALPTLTGQGGGLAAPSLGNWPVGVPMPSTPPAYLQGRDLQKNPWDVYEIGANASHATPSTGRLGVGGGAGPEMNFGAAKPKTWRDIGHEQVNSKLGQGWAENFQKAHGTSPLDFYTDKRNWFEYQSTAAQDFGVDSKEFANATIRATIEEGMKHAQEAQMWQQLHGNTPIPDEMWEHWFYVNRGQSNGPVVW